MPTTNTLGIAVFYHLPILKVKKILKGVSENGQLVEFHVQGYTLTLEPYKCTHKGNHADLAFCTEMSGPICELFSIDLATLEGKKKTRQKICRT